jgi:myo-inositol 2-dehydrogenase / D-chiro-inositol 1-dehydrogenase
MKNYARLLHDGILDMTQSPLRIAVLGVGRIGAMHAGLIAHQVPGAALAMVLDVNPEYAASVGASLGVPSTTELDAVLGSADVDAIAICTSTDTHVPILHAAVCAGKPVFCEKPISQDLAAIDDVLAAIDKAGLAFHVGFNRRFDPAHRAVRNAVISGAIGDVHLVRITSRDPAPPPISYVKSSGGLFLDMTIHDFDMARYVTGSDVVDVTAHGAVLVDPAIGEAGDVDTAVVVMRHANGALSTIDNSRRAVYGYDQRVEAFGSAGVAQSDNPPAYTTRVSTAEGVHSPSIPYFFVDRYIPAYVAQWLSFVNAVRTGEPTEITGADGRAPLVIGLAAMRSVAERRTVTIEEIEQEFR